MSETTFNPGDTVYLKSGGPPMTFERLDSDRALCNWFSRDGVLQTATFSTDCITSEYRWLWAGEGIQPLTALTSHRKKK